MPWKNLVHSSPNLILLTMYLFLQYRFLQCSHFCNCLLTAFLKLASGLKSPLLSSRASRKQMTRLQLLMSSLRLERCLLQFFSLALRALNLADMLLAESVMTGVVVQHSLTTLKKSSCSVQKFSNLNSDAFGIFVLIATLQGI